MYIKEGIILEKKINGTYSIKVTQPPECKDCVGCKKWVETDEILIVSDKRDIKPGVHVRVGIEEGKLLKLGFFVYVIPIIFLFLGIIISILVDKSFGFIISPGRAVIVGVISLFTSFYFNIKKYDMKCSNGEAELKIVDILGEI